MRKKIVFSKMAASEQLAKRKEKLKKNVKNHVKTEVLRGKMMPPTF
jgi:hypothetical protein